MIALDTRRKQLKAALSTIVVPEGIQLRPWSDADFPALQRLFAEQGWTTPLNRPEEARAAWHASWPSLVMTEKACQSPKNCLTLPGRCAMVFRRNT